MVANWTHFGPAFATAFMASLVECVEALTVVLAVGAVRGWRSALAGAGLALVVLSLAAALLGPTLSRLPIRWIHLVIGALLLVFGLRWLRKAVLRAAGSIPKRDEAAAYSRQRERFEKTVARAKGWDMEAFAASFQVALVEGIEVLFIVVAIGAGAKGLFWAASLGALAALTVIVALGVALHRPLARAPENGLKFAVGVVATALGAFWLGEGAGFHWPGGDWSAPALVAAILIASLIAVRWIARTRSSFAPR